MEWDTKLSERTTKEIIQTQNQIKNKLLSVFEDVDSFIEVRRIISDLKSR